MVLRVGGGRLREPVHVPDLEPLSNSTKVNVRQVATEKTGVSGSTASKTKMMVASGAHAFLARTDSSGERDRAKGYPNRGIPFSETEHLDAQINVPAYAQVNCPSFTTRNSSTLNILLFKQ